MMRQDGELRLGVNIDHVATVRNARGGKLPDPTRAAAVALEAGAHGITAHLREDRRHISDADLVALGELTRSSGAPLNLEIAATREMIDVAARTRPHAVCLVPERREERTTEGGLDVVNNSESLAQAVRRLREEAGARVSLFVEPSPDQVDAARAVGAQVVELHTGAYCEAASLGDTAGCAVQLRKIAAAAREARTLGLEVHAGHGLDFSTVAPVAALHDVVELNIGHFLIGEALFVGLAAAVGHMITLMHAARAVPGRDESRNLVSTGRDA